MVHRPQIWHYVVTASRRAHFPLDMLRYAYAWPATTDDANLIESLLIRQTDGLPRKVAIRLETATDIDSYSFSVHAKRWESFGFNVLVGKDADMALAAFYSGRREILDARDAAALTELTLSQFGERVLRDRLVQLSLERGTVPDEIDDIESTATQPTEVVWTHRIDAVPEIGADVEIRDHTDQRFIAVVKAPEQGDDYYGGVCDDVRFLIKQGASRGIEIVPSRNVTYWRYIGKDFGR